jgi:hypothetical protein
MEKFILKTKNGEKINITEQEDLDLSIEFFAKMKKISKKELLKIYIVEKYENRNID